MKRVLIITYYWPPSGGAGVQRWLKFTKYLPEFGWQPIVITVNPEDATYPALDPGMEKEVPATVKVIKTPSRNVFKLYQRLFKSQQVPHAGFANVDANSNPQKLARFLRGNFFIPDPRKGWNRYAYKAAKRVLSEEPGIDAIITSSPPHSTQLIGLKLHKRFRIPWIADLRDPWTDIYYYNMLYLSAPAHRVNLRFEKQVFKNARQIVTVGPTLRNLFLKKHSLPPEKIHVVYNGYDEDDFAHTPVEKDPEYTITYVGTLSDAYPIKNLIDVFLEMLETDRDIILRFVGEVSGEQRSLLKQIPEKNIEFVNYTSHPGAIAFMERTHLLLLVIPDHKTSKGILTGKLFEYLASGTPIVGIGPADGDSATILTQTGRGIMVDFEDKNGLKDAIKKYFSDFAHEQDEKSSVPVEYSRKNLTARLVDILNQTTGVDN